jgi:nitrite reductase/ring-hydroxylating ferredoxin subunit
MSGRQVRRFVEDLLRGKRPKSFRAEEADLAELRTAIILRTARPGSGAPSAEFVAKLHERLSAERAETERADAEHVGAKPDRASGQAVHGTRRRFVLGAAIAASAAAIGAGLDHIFTRRSPAEPSAQPAGGTLTPTPGAWRTVAASADLPEGGVRAFDLGTVVGFVQRAGGLVHAVSGICTHQGCRLLLDMAARRLDCPCHNAAFAVTGELVIHQLPVAPTPLPQFATREVNGAVQVFAPLARA